MKKGIISLAAAIIAIQAFSAAAYAAKENKYIIEGREIVGGDCHNITYYWAQIPTEDNKRHIRLESNSPYIEYADWEPLREDVLVPDKIWARRVVGINGSTGCWGFDLNPENEYMKCVDNVIFSKDGKTLMSYPRYYDERANYDIPAGTETIACNACAYSSFLKKVTIPESVKEIDDSAFLVCSRLSEVIFIPDDSLVNIGFWAFHSDNLEKVMLPSFNVRIDRGAFGSTADCPALLTYDRPNLKKEDHSIKWDKISYASYYEIYQKIDDEYIKIGKIKSNIWKPAGLRHGNDYTFAVKPIAVIPAENYNKEKDEGEYPESFTIEGTMSEDIAVCI